MIDSNVNAIRFRGGNLNTSGYLGVYLQSPKNSNPRWIAQVTIDGKRIAVPGRYDTALEAHEARVAFIAAHPPVIANQSTANGQVAA